MARKISICMLTLVLLGGMARAQNVSIQLTPQGVPIQIPAPGGSFNWGITLHNNETTPQTFDVWTIITLPNGSTRLGWGPVLNLTMGAGATINRVRTQYIADRYPPGNYTYTGNVGTYPNSVWDSDSFPFTKTLAGSQLWVARYNGPGNGDDNVFSLILDSGGNVYVTGDCFDSTSGNNYATIKYDVSGNQLWLATYNGPANGYDHGADIAMDGNGNVYVTGSSPGSGTSGDYATIKYNSAGVEQWVARYSGPGNYPDGAGALALDAVGNVYVTGAAYFSGTGSDYTTIKYNSAGVEQWVARYNGPGNVGDYARAITLDASGNIYITGSSVLSGFDRDYATVKYDPAGNQLWVARYNGLGGLYLDDAYALAVDAVGNVYVTGSSYGNGTGVDYATIKYNSAGVQQWVARYSGELESWSDGAHDLAVDAAGNVYVTGTCAFNGTQFDYTTIKYNSAGVQQWVARYNGPLNSSDGGSALALDAASNVYVTGYSIGSSLNTDYATVKYNSAGIEQWVARYNGPGNGDDFGGSLALDAAGNVYVTGYSTGIGTGDDYCTIKYSGGNLDNWMPVEAAVFGQSAWGGPQECRLEPNYPNPFNASTAISYELRAASYVSLKVYDTAGRLVETLVDGWRSAGTHELTFDASDLPSGMYVYQLEAGEHSVSSKMVLMK